MARLLAWDEQIGFLFRHPTARFTLPTQGKLVSDSTFGCVLLFAKTDGTVLYVQADDIYPNCSWNAGDESPNAAYLETLGTELINNAKNLGQVTIDVGKYILIAAIVGGIYWLFWSGTAQKFMKQLK